MVGAAVFRAREALRRAEALYLQAISESDPGNHFRTTYLAALRGAAAVLEYHQGDRNVRKKTRNAWVLLSQLPGEWARWGQYFAEFSGRRAAMEAGASYRLEEEEIEELFRSTGRFLDQVQDLLGPPAREGAA